MHDAHLASLFSFIFPATAKPKDTCNSLAERGFVVTMSMTRTRARPMAPVASFVLQMVIEKLCASVETYHNNCPASCDDCWSAMAMATRAVMPSAATRGGSNHDRLLAGSKPSAVLRLIVACIVSSVWIHWLPMLRLWVWHPGLGRLGVVGHYSYTIVSGVVVERRKWFNSNQHKLMPGYYINTSPKLCSLYSR